jgi:hypothetical protein
LTKARPEAREDIKKRAIHLNAVGTKYGDVKATTCPNLQAGRGSPTSPLLARPQPVAVTALKWIAL